MTKFLNISLNIQLLLVLLFCYLGFQADLAMDKTGIGDYNQFNKYNMLAGLAFYTLSGSWLLTLSLIVAKNIYQQTLSKMCISFPPIALVIGWFSSFLLYI